VGELQASATYCVTMDGVAAGSTQADGDSVADISLTVQKQHSVSN